MVPWGTVHAQGITDPPEVYALPTSQDSEVTVESLQAQIDDLTAQLQSWEQRLGGDNPIGPGECNATCEPLIRRLPVVAEETVEPCTKAGEDEVQVIRFLADYDKGFRIRPVDADATPFELIVNGWIQFRHVGFARDVESWTDNAGVTREVRNRNAFDIERSRIYFKGYAFDKRLSYFYHLDGDTDGRHTVDFFDYWWAWDFSERLRVQFGKRKVPGSRQWLLGARRTRFADRPMANDFFRPDRTIGLYALGNIGDIDHYEVMVGNGYRSANLPNSLTDDTFTFAMTQYFDPLGDYGSQIVDYDWTCDPLIRFGHSFAFAPTKSGVPGVPRGESDFIRLTDGTRISQTGALAPGVTVSTGDLYFYGVDFAAKWRGWSWNSEVFFRWLEELEGDGPLPHTDLFQRGWYVEGGTFLVPQKVDVNFRYSAVQGLFKDSTEYAAGANWYPLDNFRLKVTFDVSVLDGSPLQNTASEVLVGDDGVLFRTQIQAEF